MTNNPIQIPQFFLSAPGKCPYLCDKIERKIFTYLDGNDAVERNDDLTFHGFRRSQNIAYRPVCDGCTACISVRIPVHQFQMSQSMRRIYHNNNDLICKKVAFKTTDEQYNLFRHYVNSRHVDGGMAHMSYEDFQAMVEQSPIHTCLYEYRLKQSSSDQSQLVGVALTDLITDGFSMVYSFYDIEQTKRSLGTQMILDHIMRAQNINLSYIYLGYWVEGSNKMDYKQKFKPLEYFVWDRWQDTAL